mmetsp:Transcript_10738/g.14413  ORF Transcript_10738/g.14413 Transcript_10738/m.14413 type:complete len:111 (+) Transcript_10738:116-448(+)
MTEEDKMGFWPIHIFHNDGQSLKIPMVRPIAGQWLHSRVVHLHQTLHSSTSIFGWETLLVNDNVMRCLEPVGLFHNPVGLLSNPLGGAHQTNKFSAITIRVIANVRFRQF